MEALGERGGGGGSDTESQQTTLEKKNALLVFVFLLDEDKRVHSAGVQCNQPDS